MKKTYFYYISAFSLLLVVSCTGWHKMAQADGNVPLLSGGPAWGALWQQHAAEYKALTYQAYNIARVRLDQRLEEKNARPRAIITDIDETVLDNSPYFIREAQKGSGYADPTWLKWTSEIRCDTIPGAAGFLAYARSKDVAVFYITNRFQAEQASTLKNLQKFNLPNADASHLFLVNAENWSKEDRRQSILKDYEVILLLGDNLGDFDKVFEGLDLQKRNKVTEDNASQFGNRFIVFPNVVYGAWEDVLYEKGTLSKKDKNTQLNKYLIKGGK